MELRPAAEHTLDEGTRVPRASDGGRARAVELGPAEEAAPVRGAQTAAHQGYG
jgi:hypothetical protein